MEGDCLPWRSAARKRVPVAAMRTTEALTSRKKLPTTLYLGGVQSLKTLYISAFKLTEPRFLTPKT